MYVGRIVSIGMTKRGKLVGMYRVSSRSFPNRCARDMGDRVAIVPKQGFEQDVFTNPYISYNCLRKFGKYLVVSNGSHTDSIAEKLEAGMSSRDALALVLLSMDYERDDYNTPRIAGIVQKGTNKAYLAIVCDDALLVQSFVLKKGNAYYVATYEHNKPSCNYRDEEFDINSSDEACDYILGKGVFARLINPITAVCGFETNDGYEVSFKDFLNFRCMNILGIESSCDETAVSIVADGHNVKANIISSQVSKHAKYGGVVPELAAREHLVNIQFVCQQALQESKLTMREVDGIAVTNNPGLLPALLVGTSFAKGLALRYKVPIVGVNHLVAHLYAGFIPHKDLLQQRETFPIVCLLVSGGHTNLLMIDSFGKCSYIGGTLDDAVGEAYDKVARLLGLGYPGGPIVDSYAKKGDSKAIKLPRPLLNSTKKKDDDNRFNFSFSGLKTAVYYMVKDRELSEREVFDICASFQEAVVEILLAKTFEVCRYYESKTIVLGGGVACNSSLRQNMQQKGRSLGINVILTQREYCTDNAAMIAGLGYYRIKSKKQGSNFDVYSRADMSNLETVEFV